MRRLLLLLFLSLGLQAQVPHPRIWLDSSTLTRLNGLAAASDPTWTAFKAQADAYLTYTIAPAYTSMNCTGGYDICFNGGSLGAYEGNQWLNGVRSLSLAYRLTGNLAYANQTKLIFKAMIAAGAAPLTINNGYAARNVVLALALGYDWIYDQLSATYDTIGAGSGNDIGNLTALFDAYWAQLQLAPTYFGWADSNVNASSNYTGADLLSFGLGALTLEGDDANATAIQAAILAKYDTIFAPALATGQLQGGYPLEGYNYGPEHYERVMQWMQGMKTAGKTDFISGSGWPQIAAKNLLYNLKPDLWSTTDEGDFPALVHAMYWGYPYFLSSVLSGLPEGGWMAWMYNHATPLPPEASSSAVAVDTFDKFLYNSGVTPVDYTATQPTYYFSPGDNHSYVRSSWLTSATETTFNGNTRPYGHGMRGAGNVSLQRGADFLLINAGQWASGTQFGVAGSPKAFDEASWRMNTLYYWDNATGTGKCNSQTQSSSQYAGCQMFWPGIGAVIHAEGPQFVYSKADLRPAYFNSSGLTTINSYYRSFLNVGGDVTFVFDRIDVTDASFTRKLFWHLNPVAANSASGKTVKTSVGASSLYITTLLPASATVALVDEPTSWGGSTRITTRVEASEPVPSTTTQFLTVLAPVDSGVTVAPAAALVDAVNFKGGLYDDGAYPRIGLFSADSSPQVSVTYTVDYEDRLAGRHVVVDLKPGSYTVRKNGRIVFAGLPVERDGTLSFTSYGGATYTVSLDTPPPGGVRGRSAVTGRTALR